MNRTTGFQPLRFYKINGQQNTNRTSGLQALARLIKNKWTAERDSCQWPPGPRAVNRQHIAVGNLKVVSALSTNKLHWLCSADLWLAEFLAEDSTIEHCSVVLFAKMKSILSKKSLRISLTSSIFGKEP